MRIVVKQEHVEREVVQEFDFALFDSRGEIVDRPLTTDDLKFVARPVGNIGDFDVNEAFEVHFVVKDPSPFRHFSQTGFTEISPSTSAQLGERLATISMNWRKRRAKNRADNRARGAGSALLGTRVARYEPLRDPTKLQDRAQVSVHRKSKLDRVVKIGEEVAIKYTGKQGAVS